MQVLVLEASTSAAKALVYDLELGVVAEEGEAYSPEIDSGGVHDAHQVYLSMMRLGRKAAAGRDIAAIGVGGVWHTILACDSAMNPVSRTYLWNFTGTDAISRSVRNQTEKAREIYRQTGCMPNITYQPYAILYMKEQGLDVRGKLFASQGGYNFFRLTGERLETKCITSGMGLLNTHKLRYDEGVMEMCGVTPEQFGELADYRSVRPLQKEAAEALGVAAGIPVVPPHADGALNQLGNGAMRPGRMTFSVGTSAAIRLSTAKPVLSDPPATWCYVGVEGWMSGAATNGACNCINWFKEDFLQNKWSFDELGSGLLDSGPTPVFLPFLFGERCPGWEDTRRGGFQDLTGQDSVASLFRAMSEGILFNVYQCYQILTKLDGVPNRIILSGGILNSKDWMQMAADIFQREIEISDSAQASMLGAAALALYAAGALESPNDFVDVEQEKVFPRPASEGRYEEKYQRYLDFYNRKA